MAELTGFEPTPHVLLVGIVEPLTQKFNHFHKGIEGGVLVLLVSGFFDTI